MQSITFINVPPKKPRKRTRGRFRCAAGGLSVNQLANKSTHKRTYNNSPRTQPNRKYADQQTNGAAPTTVFGAPKIFSTQRRHHVIQYGNHQGNNAQYHQYGPPDFVIRSRKVHCKQTRVRQRRTRQTGKTDPMMPVTMSRAAKMSRNISIRLKNFASLSAAFSASRISFSCLMVLSLNPHRCKMPWAITRCNSHKRIRRRYGHFLLRGEC